MVGKMIFLDRVVVGGFCWAVARFATFRALALEAPDATEKVRKWSVHVRSFQVMRRMQQNALHFLICLVYVLDTCCI